MMSNSNYEKFKNDKRSSNPKRPEERLAKEFSKKRRNKGWDYWEEK